MRVMPNTAGCRTPKEAIATAQMARELFDTPWIKLELIGDDYTLQPDTLNLVDAGLGLPSHACQVMEWGYDGVLLNSAVALAQDPVAMAGAFADAVQAGRDARRAGAMAAQESAQPSTPVLGTPFWHHAASQ